MTAKKNGAVKNEKADDEEAQIGPVEFDDLPQGDPDMPLAPEGTPEVDEVDVSKIIYGTKEKKVEVVDDLRCEWCNGPIHAGKAIKCNCGAVVHQYCFNSHAIKHHMPSYTIVEVKTSAIYDSTGAYKGSRVEYTESTGTNV